MKTFILLIKGEKHISKELMMMADAVAEILTDGVSVKIIKDRMGRPGIANCVEWIMGTGCVSYLQGWVTKLGLRHQGMLLTSIRGCDIRGKYAPEKPLIREMRGLIGVAFDPRELDFPKGFMCKFNKAWSGPAFEDMCKEIDGLPVHYVMHILHSIEIIGYHHPESEVRMEYSYRYFYLCDKFHLKPESKDEMEGRLREDRIAKGTVEM